MTEEEVILLLEELKNDALTAGKVIQDALVNNSVKMYPAILAMASIVDYARNSDKGLDELLRLHEKSKTQHVFSAATEVH